MTIVLSKHPQLFGFAALLLFAVSTNQVRGDDSQQTDAIKLDFVSSGIGTIKREFSASIMELDAEKPTGIKKLPADLDSPQFGKLKLGPKESASRFFVVWDAPKDKPSRLLIDLNGNGDLTDDPEPKWQLRPNTPTQSYAGEAQFEVAYGKEKLPMTVKFSSLQGKLRYYRDYGRIGEITLGG